MPLGSYRHWILKRWHEMLVRKKLVVQSTDGEFIPYKNTAQEVGGWLMLYDKYMDARDHGYKLTPDEAFRIRSENLFVEDKK